jgi:tetratricopeptide (TPR) repeat protein
MARTFASRSALSEAIALINAGQIAKAEEICRSAVSRNQDDVNMVALLGATLLKSKQIDEAEKFLRQAIQLAPSFAKPHEDLGHLLLNKGQPEEAVTILQKATRLDPDLDYAWFNLGKARAMLGKGKEADEAFEKSFDLNPERKMLALAAEHQKAGRLKEAEEMYAQILRSNPTNVDALRLSGHAAMRSGQIYKAERLFRRAVSNAPDFVLLHIDLGNTLKEQNRLSEAIEQFKEAIELEPGNVHAHYLLASVLSLAALTYESVEAYQKVLALKPTHTGAMLGLGHVLKTVGRQDEAVESYRNCILAKPNFGETWWSLANLKTYKLTETDIHEMESLLSTADDPEAEISEQSRVNFLFALAKAYEDSGNFERAWGHYKEGNSRQRVLENYDPVRTEVMADEIIEVFNHDFLSNFSSNFSSGHPQTITSSSGHPQAVPPQAVPPNSGHPQTLSSDSTKGGLGPSSGHPPTGGSSGHPSNEPIFVVGLPRSGSTLIEQILASHSQVEGTSELPYAGLVATSLSRNRADGVNYPHAVHELSSEHFVRLGRDYLDLARIHRTEGAPRFIDKMPNNFPTIGFLHLVLPNAKIIDARRYPLDSCLSCYRQLFARGQNFTYDLTDIGEYFLQYQRLMDHWHEVLPGRCLTVQYEEMVTDFENQVRRLLDFCDLPFEDACLNYYKTDRPVRTASSEQVRQPVYSKSVHFWRNHEEYLAELIEVLEPVLPRYQKYESINRP